MEALPFLTVGQRHEAGGDDAGLRVYVRVIALAQDAQGAVGPVQPLDDVDVLLVGA